MREVTVDSGINQSGERLLGGFLRSDERARRRPDSSPRAGWLAALAVLSAVVLLTPAPARGQDARPLIDVEAYNIAAEIDLPTQSLEAITEVRFIPREETERVVFELHNALNVTQVVDEEGNEVPISRSRRDFTVHLSFPDTLPVGQPLNVTFMYSGRFEGAENSPVEGVSLASIEPDRAYLLYPARWFPVNGYSADRFSANIAVTVDPGFQVIGSGIRTSEQADGKVVHRFEFSRTSFPGSIAVVQGDPTRVNSDGVTTEFYFKSAPEETLQAYGEAAAQMMQFFTEKFGPPYASSLTLVETGEYAPNAYAAPGVLFFAPWAIGQEVDRRLLGRQVAHQWWRVMVSPGNRNHIWLDLGTALYASLLEYEANLGEADFHAQIDDVRIEALTFTDIPILQSSRVPDFSPELNALAGGKGAMVLHMLRWTIGDEAFFTTLRQFIDKYQWQSATTDDFRLVAETASGKNLQPFFIQWTENSGTPEFTQEYTIYRVGGGKGFRVIGKVQQDLDTFSMPVELKIETEGEPEYEVVEVTGTSSDYVVEAFGKPKKVVLDPNNRILRYDEDTHVRVAIRKGEQLVELGYYTEALTEYQKALDINRFSSLAHYRIGEVFFLQNNYQSAANEFREALNGNRNPEWTVVWSHINLGKIFDITGQRERAVNEYQLALRTRDNTQGAQDEARKHLEEPYRRPRRQERIY